jgi:hypothetical protein
VTELAQALAKSREIIESALAEARGELATLEARRAELMALIAQGEAALSGSQPSETTPVMTLHEALELILREAGAPMTARQLADAVNDRGLYRTRDGTPVEVNQIHARTSNYESIFEKDGPLINLRELTRRAALATIEHFKDDDRGFFDWLADNPGGYFINAERRPKRNYLVLHRPSCPHYKGEPSLNWTKDYVKFCSPNRSDLEEWAASTIGGEVTLCRSCFG